MRLGTLVIALVCAVGCGKKKQPAATPPAGSGSAVAAAGSAAPAAAELAFDTPDPSEDPEPSVIAFGGKSPRLPAINAAGTQIADWDYLADGPMPPPQPMAIAIREIETGKAVATLPIFSEKEADAAQNGSGTWQTPELTKQLVARGDAAKAQLHGFHSLAKVDFAAASSGDDQPTKVGDDILDPEMLELRDAHGTVLHRIPLDEYSTGSDEMTMCSYRPMLMAAYRDGNTLYVDAGYHYRDDCEAPQSYTYAWSLDPAKADPAATARGLVEHQFDAAPAIAVTTNGQPATALADKARPADKLDTVVTMSRDGTAAWGGMTAGDFVRASDVLVKTPGGWQLAAATWTVPVDNADANRDAKLGKRKAAALAGDPGDQSLRDAFAKLTTDGVDAAAATRTDLVAVGSGPGERTVGGAMFARAWNAAWKGKVNVVSAIAHAAPSGTAGWVTASIELAKPGYKVPFLVFAVFEKTADGHWSLVQIHFAV